MAGGDQAGALPGPDGGFIVLFRIHSKEYFKEKYAVDEVQYTDEVRS